MLTLLRLLLFLLLLHIVCLGHSQTGGSSSFNFLNIAGSARVGSLGGSGLALKDHDPSLIINNPAILDSSMEKTGVITYLRYFAGSNYGNMLYVKKNKFGMFAYNLNFLNYGRFEKRDNGGNILGSFSAGDYGFNLSYGYQLDSNFSFGANLRSLFSQIDNRYSLALSLDASMIYDRPDIGYTIAFAIKNMGYQIIRFENNPRKNLPLDIQLGFSYKPKHLPARLFITANNLNNWNLAVSDTLGVGLETDLFEQPSNQISVTPTFFDELARHFVIGTEFYLSKSLFLRAAFNYRRRVDLSDSRYAGLSGFSWGLGFRIQKFYISYGSEGFHKSGASNYITITRKF